MKNFTSLSISTTHCTLLLLLIASVSFGQAVGINIATPQPSSMLDISSNAKGFLMPRMVSSLRTGIGSPAKGLMVFDSTLNDFYFYAAGWKPLLTSTSGWQVMGNTAINPATQFIGTTDAQPLVFRINNLPAGRLDPNFYNVAFGRQTLAHAVTAYSNVVLGDSAMYNSNSSNTVAIGARAGINNAAGFSTLIGYEAGQQNASLDNVFVGCYAGKKSTGSSNTFVGYSSGMMNTIGFGNTAFGTLTLTANTDGEQNTAVGNVALQHNSAGYQNTAIGSGALQFNSTGDANTAIGFNAMVASMSGGNNTAVGWSALALNSTGYSNVCIGEATCSSNTSGYRNIGMGASAMSSNTSGYNNAAVGYSAMFSNTTGFNNAAFGYGALFAISNSQNNTAIGVNALLNTTSGNHNTGVGKDVMHSNIDGVNNASLGINALYFTTTSDNLVAVGAYAGDGPNNGDNNTFVGAFSDATGVVTNSTAVGYNTMVTASNQIRMGVSSITSIGGYEPWTDVSDGRFKKNVREDIPGLSFISKLRPVTYNLDVSGISKHIGEFIDHEMDLGTKAAMQAKELVRYTGFIAQEVEVAAAEIDYDFNGVDTPDNDKDLYGLRYAEFVVPLVKAVQEEQQLIHAQQAEIDLLKEEVELLKKEIETHKTN